MHHGGEGSASATAHIQRGACDCRCRRDAAKKRYDHIANSLANKFTIRIMLPASHSVSYNCAKQGLECAKYSDRHRRAEQACENRVYPFHGVYFNSPGHSERRS